MSWREILNNVFRADDDEKIISVEQNVQYVFVLKLSKEKLLM